MVSVFLRTVEISSCTHPPASNSNTWIILAYLGAIWLLSLLSLSVAQEGNVNIKAVTYPVCHAETPHYDSSTDNLIFIDLCGKKFCIHNLLNEETHCTCCLGTFHQCLTVSF
nr:PREDICTED: uncharacterized protein LOC109034189 [Bemisia tabaci]